MSALCHGAGTENGYDGFMYVTIPNCLAKKVFINGRLICEGDSLDEEALKTSGYAIRV